MAGFDVNLTITGIQEVQRANLQAIAALRPQGAFGRAIIYAATAAHRYAVAITHVDTGSLRASHRVEVKGTRGRIYIDPNSVNPRSRTRPVVYGVYEHQRGGSHAFYQRVVDERGSDIADGALRELMRGLP
jgi:hypothetical protein